MRSTVTDGGGRSPETLDKSKVMATPSPLTFENIGLPEGHGFPQLAYHPFTRTIIAHTRPDESRLPTHRLSIRFLNEPKYEPIGDFPPSTSISSFALCSKVALLYFITLSWIEIDGTVAADWDALYSFTLDTRQCEIVARRGDLQSTQSDSPVMIAALLAASDDGDVIYCNAALQANDGTTDYWLSELTLADLKVKSLTRLESVFA